MKTTRGAQAACEDRGSSPQAVSEDIASLFMSNERATGIKLAELRLQIHLLWPMGLPWRRCASNDARQRCTAIGWYVFLIARSFHSNFETENSRVSGEPLACRMLWGSKHSRTYTPLQTGA